MFAHSMRKIINFLVLLHANDIVFSRVRSGAYEPKPIAVFGIRGINIKQRYLP